MRPTERGPLATARVIRAGDLLHLTRDACPQFDRPIVVRVIRELADRHTYHGWTWVEAYELDARSEAVFRAVPPGAARACGIAWPCYPSKLRLLAEYRGNRVGLLIHLAALQVEAAAELAEVVLPARLAERFTGWAGRPG